MVEVVLRSFAGPHSEQLKAPQNETKPKEGERSWPAGPTSGMLDCWALPASAVMKLPLTLAATGKSVSAAEGSESSNPQSGPEVLCPLP